MPIQSNSTIYQQLALGAAPVARAMGGSGIYSAGQQLPPGLGQDAQMSNAMPMGGNGIFSAGQASPGLASDASVSSAAPLGAGIGAEARALPPTIGVQRPVWGGPPTAPSTSAILSADVPKSIAAGGLEDAAVSSPSWLSQLKPVLSKGSLLKAGGLATAGYLGGEALRAGIGNRDGTWDDAGVDAIKGAGLGAAVGSVVPVIGTGLGAGIGALAGGAYGFFKGGDSDATSLHKTLKKEDAKLQKVLGVAGLSTEAQHQINLQLITASQYATNPAELKQMYKDAATSVPAIAAQEQQQRQQLAGLLATQQALSPQYDTYLKGLGADAHAFQQSTNAMADTIGNPTQQAYMKQLGAQSVLSNDATAAAYKAQMGGQAAQMASQIGAPQSMYQQLLAQYG